MQDSEPLSRGVCERHVQSVYLIKLIDIHNV